MSKKFLLISQVFYPDEVSTAGLFTNLCSVIAEDDYEVIVWCAHPSYSVLNRQPKKVVYKGIKIFYLPSTNFHKDNLLGRLSNIVTFSLSVFLKLLITRDREPVFTHTTPPMLGSLIGFTCRIKKRKFIYILLDILPEGLIRLRKISGQSFLTNLWQKSFQYSIAKSWNLIVLGRDMQNWLEQAFPAAAPKILYMPHWQDDSLINPVDFNKNEIVKELGLENNFVVQYSGNMGLWNDMATLGKAVNEDIGNVKFMFVGGGVRKEELVQNIKDENKARTVFLPFQPANRFSKVVTACHVAVVSMREGLSGMAVPCKIYGILASGIPVIAVVPPDSEIAMVVREENCGIVTKPGDVKEFSDAVRFLESNETIRIKMGLNGRKAFEMKYTTRLIAEKYKFLINNLAEVKS